VTEPRLELTRAQILAFRRRAGALTARLPLDADSLRCAAWAGLKDSMPRAAGLSIHARVEGTQAETWEDPSLVQLWGPGYHAYVVAASDVAVFTLGRLPGNPGRLRLGSDLASRLEAFLDGRRMRYGEAGRALGVNPNQLRYAAPTGRILIRWDGARQPVIWTVPPPETDPAEARLELARRHLHILGPATPEGFGRWAGIRPPLADSAFDSLRAELTPVRTPTGDAWALASDEPALHAAPGPEAPARLLPSGDAYFLLYGADRHLLVPEPDRSRDLWTSRVWPGAVLVDGEIVGTWRRSKDRVTIQSWRRLSAAERHAIEGEASSLPLPEITGQVRVGWGD
jgi:hypothetical protein